MKCLEMMYFMLKLVIYLILIIQAIWWWEVIKYEPRDNSSNYSGFGNVVSKGGSGGVN
jgi:hypothetical protein